MMSSLYIGATGLKSQGEAIGVVSNNLANVNTIAYKQTSTQFSDLLSSYLCGGSSSGTGVSQTGLGAAVSAIRTLFTQGSLESTTQLTDVAVNGIGFFGVQSNGVTRYTRAGNFSFTKDGALVDANGWTVLGRHINNGVESSSATPLVLDLSSSGIGGMAGKASTQVTACAQLGGVTDSTGDAANPFFALASSWNGSSSPPLSESAYSYSQAFEFYDSNGNRQSGTIYYDLAGSSGGSTAVEYVVALDPSRDGSSLAGTQAAGLLMAGTLTFNSSGELVNMTAFTPPSSGDPTDLSGWTAASTVNGLPAFSVTPSGSAAQTIGLDMGLSLSGSASAGLATAADAASNAPAIYSSGTSAQKNAVSSTAYGDNTGTVSSSCDGYASGDLRSLTIGSDGTVSASYTNGQSQDVCRISLYRFTSQDGLQHEGGGLYSATSASGAAQEGRAEDENFGSIEQYALEQSNVDYATEFSTLIVTQRAFQMNSKVITTCDTMLQKALEIKR